jgi:nucleotide-binding universal stress UspA family protein
MLMRKVLIPVDGSAKSLAAVRDVALAGAREIDRVHLLHVQARLPRHVARWIPRAQREAWRLQRADEALARARGELERRGIPIDVHVALGPVSTAVCAAARRLGVHEIVLGATRRGPVAAWLANSTSARLIEASPVPVRVIPAAAASWLDRLALPAGLGVAALLLLD